MLLPIMNSPDKTVVGIAQHAISRLFPADRLKGIPLSLAQQRLWFLHQLDNGSAAYHIHFGSHLKGQLNLSAVQKALNQLIVRHEVLRTTFLTNSNGEPFQYIDPGETSHFTLHEYDLRKHGDPESELRRLAIVEINTPFLLDAGPLIRGTLIQLAHEHHILLIVMHHIISDGWSIGIFRREFGVLYNAYRSQAAVRLPELAIQYADYSAWQRCRLEGTQFQYQADYWKSTLTGAPALLVLPTDRTRPAEKDEAGASIEVLIDETLVTGLKRLSRNNGNTLYMTLLCAWAILLFRLSGQEDLVIGTPVANRGHLEVEGLIGFFVNTLALRLDFSTSPSVCETLKQVKRKIFEAQRHQDIPFEQVVEIVQPSRSLAHSPIIQHLFNWLNTDTGLIDLDGLKQQRFDSMPEVTTKFDLTLSLREKDGCISGKLIYATTLFEKSTVARYIRYFKSLLASMVDDDTQCVNSLTILSEAERNQVLYLWNETKSAFADDKCIHHLFQEQVAQRPNASALKYGTAVLSYAELDCQANSLAHYLRELGARPDDRIVICAERSFNLVIGLMAILKAGAAYVPLDPHYPLERLRFMLQDSGAGIFLFDSSVTPSLGNVDDKIRVLNLRDIHLWMNQPTTAPSAEDVGLTSNHLAYVIYTSGSTGRPKGVMVEHRSVVNLLIWTQNRFRLHQDDAVLQLSSISFDASVRELFWPLTSGGQVVLLPSNKINNLDDFVRIIDSDNITAVRFSPSILQSLLVEGQYNSLSTSLNIICGGEALSTHLARSILKYFVGSSLHNSYGPTETTVNAAAWTCTSDQSLEEIPIGRPIANVKIYILDELQMPVPVGVVGEICIGGVGVARGYLNRPELTIEKFLPNPFIQLKGEKMYRSGDLGRWRADGNIDFIGRNDSQIKLRGFRIELGEIQSRLLEHPSIGEAAVIVSTSVSDDQTLVAYYTKSDTSSIDIEPEILRAHLSIALPSYMIPATYRCLESLPLTPNGKLDRDRLPSVEQMLRHRPDYEAPIGESEVILAGIWAEVLRIGNVGRHDNFFELGGHSLLGIRILTRITAKLNKTVTLKAIFMYQTIYLLAKELDSTPSTTGALRMTAIPLHTSSSDVPLTTNQENWLMIEEVYETHRVALDAYNISCALEFDGPLSYETLERTLNSVIDKHSSLRSEFEVSSTVDRATRLRLIHDFHTSRTFVRGLFRCTIAPSAPLTLEVSDLTWLEAYRRPSKLSKLWRALLSQAFVYNVAPLLRAKLIKLESNKHIVILVLAHIVCDIESLQVLKAEICSTYYHLTGSSYSASVSLPIQFYDFARWQNSYLTSQDAESGIGHWLQVWNTFRPYHIGAHNSSPSPKKHSTIYSQIRVAHTISKIALKDVREFSRTSRTTSFISLFASFCITLKFLYGGERIGLWTSFGNRGGAELEVLIGWFVNMHLVGVDLSLTQTGQDVVSNVREAFVKAATYQNVPTAEIWNKLEKPPLPNPPEIKFNLRVPDLHPLPKLASAHPVQISHFRMPTCRVGNKKTMRRQPPGLLVEVIDNAADIELNLIATGGFISRAGLRTLLDRWVSVTFAMVDKPGSRYEEY